MVWNRLFLNVKCTVASLLRYLQPQIPHTPFNFDRLYSYCVPSSNFRWWLPFLAFPSIFSAMYGHVQLSKPIIVKWKRIFINFYLPWVKFCCLIKRQVRILLCFHVHDCVCCRPSVRISSVFSFFERFLFGIMLILAQNEISTNFRSTEIVHFGNIHNF